MKIIKRWFLALFVIIIAYSAKGQNEILSPQQYLGYSLGEQFTYHHRVVAYYNYVAQTSNQVKFVEYGLTNERRPLIVAILSSEENIKNLEKHRLANLSATGLSKSADNSSEIKPIVWLSYNIHGDEAAGTEAALKTLYHLATDKGVQKWLEETIVILDPCENPDGRDRYANWYNRVVNKSPSSDINSMEHRQPWPGGRFNHYLFDLNRDWAWQTQIESVNRVKLYRQWMPHIHVDLHEMGYNSPYFFAPAAAPYHETITGWQRDFQDLVGQSNANYFDENGWLYYTKEIFDLLYPSYGDTWPTFNGAIGFTYERGGSGRAGLTIKQRTGNYVTLKDRLDNHFTASISTIETAYTNRVKLIDEFKKYFDTPVSDKYSTYIIKNDNTSRLTALLNLLDKQQIEYGAPNKSEISLSGYNYLSNKETSFQLKSDDIIIRLNQPLSRFVKVLFEPKTALEDSLTYDLTAWAVPYIYELEAYAVKEDISNSVSKFKNDFTNTTLLDKAPYAIAIKYDDVQGVRILGDLLQANLVVRFAEKPFTSKGESFDRGTLIISKGDNQSRYLRYDKEVLTITNKHKKAVYFLNTGLATSGYDLGSGYMTYVKPSKVALIGGDDISPTAYGEAWYYFEQVLDYPVVTLNTSYLNSVDLSEYDVIVLPSGSYSRYSKKLLDFASDGGKIIALDRAASSLARDSNTRFSTKKNGGSSNDGKIKYDEQERASASRLVAGSIYKVHLDETHPLSFGLGEQVHIMKRNSTVFEEYEGSGWMAGRFGDDSHISGFVGSNLKKDLVNSAAIVVENYGRGEIVYFPDSPIFRGFWHSGKLLFGNALFLVGQ